MEKRGKIVKIWRSLTLGRKVGTILIGSGTVIVLLLLFSVYWIYSFTDEIQDILQDNLSAYYFQENLSAEIRAFSAYMTERTTEKEELLTAACQTTEKSLEELPREYEKIGKERYALTRNIENNYMLYRERREAVVGMSGLEDQYITSLYEVYRMQQYLEQYAMQLSRKALEQENSYYGKNIQLFQQIPYMVCGVAGIWFAVFSLFLWKMTKSSIIRPVSMLAGEVRRIEKNDFSGEDVHWEGEDEIGELVTAFNTMKHSLENYVKTLEEKQLVEEKLYQKELEKANLEQRFSFAQLQLIKSQLNPHFLFNTLNMVTRMAQMEEAAVTGEMLIALSNLLRYSLRTAEPFAPLNQELKVVEDYLYLQKMRFGERIRWEITCQVADAQIYIPVFLIQPLVENAIIHGLSDREEGGIVRVMVLEEDGMHIIVQDTGVGMPAEVLEKIRESIGKRESGLGIGLGNIYRRITAYYEQGGVTVDSKPGEGTTVNIFLGRRK